VKTKLPINYIHGHNTKGKKMIYSEEGLETKKENGKTLLQWHKDHPKESKDIMESNWNKTVRTWKGSNHPLCNKEVPKERVAKRINTIIRRYGKFKSNEGSKWGHKARINFSNKQRKEYKEGNRTIWNKGITGEEFFKHYSLSREELLKLHLEGLLKRPTSFEKIISKICIENNLPFVYTGNGTFLIGYKNPDFINQSKKVVIEVYHPYFKIRDFGSCEKYEKQRGEHFAKYGWKTIFINGDIFRNNPDWKSVCLNKIKGGI
jgi:hypothetical protein